MRNSIYTERGWLYLEYLDIGKAELVSEDYEAVGIMYYVPGHNPIIFWYSNQLDKEEWLDVYEDLLSTDSGS